MDFTREIQELQKLKDYYNNLAASAKDNAETKKYNELAFDVMKKKQKLREKLIFQQMEKR